MKNSIFLLCACFGSGGRHLATPIPVEGKLATTITPEGNHIYSLPSPFGDFEQGREGKLAATISPEGLPSGNDNFGGRHLATPIPVEGKLSPEGLPSGNDDF